MGAEAGWRPGPRGAITDVPGIRVGQWSDRRAGTGCTVVLCEGAVAAAVDVRGGAPGTRETDVLSGANLVRTCHAICLAGGSAFGLAAASGVMRWCAEHDIGFPTRQRKVPIVSSAVVFDLGVGKPDAFPGEHEGYLAASRARAGRVEEGTAGAGTGATVAKLLGPEACLKGGVGTASLLGPRGIVVGALVVTNAVGSIVDPATGELVAGPRDCRDGSPRFVPLAEALERRTAQMDALVENTTLAVVATNAALDHHRLQRVAYLAHDGLARTILPAHTGGDGDTAFAVTFGTCQVRDDDALTVAALAQAAVEQAVLRSVRLATPLGGVPSAAAFLAGAAIRK